MTNQTVLEQGGASDSLVEGDPESTDGAKFQEFFPAIAELTAAQDDNEVGSVDGPTHSGLFQPLDDVGLGMSLQSK